MADVSKTIEIIFGAVDNTAGALVSVGKGISDFSGAAKEAIAPLNAMADAIKLIDTAVVATGIALGGAALQKAGEFGDNIAQIGVLFDGTAGQVGAFERSVIDYASSSTKSIKDITDALKEAIGSGVEYGKSVEFITKAEQLALGASGSLTDATTLLVGSMNAYGASTSQAGKYTDVLMQTVLLGKTTLPELAQSLSNVSGTAAAAKVPFEDINAAIAAMTATGAPTSQAITAINQAIVSLINPSKQARDEAEKLGINFSATALATDGLKGTLDKVYKATNGNVESLGLLFGSVDALKAVTILGADNAGVFAKALDVMKTSSGSAAAAAETLRQQWSVSLQQMSNAMDIMLISIGKKLNEGGEFSGIIQALKDVFKGITFAVNDGAFDDVFDTFQGIATRLSAFLSGIAEALPEALARVDFSKFMGAATGLADVFASLFDGIDLTTPEGLAKAIQNVTDVLANLLNAGAGIAEVWVKAAQTAAPLIQQFGEMDAATARAAGKTLGFADVLTILLGGLGSVGKGLEAVGTGIELLAGAQIGKLAIGLVQSEKAMGAVALAARGAGVALGLTAQAGLVGAAGAAGYAVGTVLNEGINLVVRGLSGSNSLGGLIYDLTHSTEGLADSAPKAADGLSTISTAAQNVSGQTSDATKAIEHVGFASSSTGEMVNDFLIKSMITLAIKAGDASAKTDFLAASAAALKNPSIEARDAMASAAAAFKDAAFRSGEMAAASTLIRSEYGKLGAGADSVSKQLKTSSDVMEVLGSKTNLTNKELIELAKNTKAAEVELEKIASNERIKLIEANVTLNVAEIEAETKRIEAAFESINTTINSTGGMLGDLFQILANPNLDWSALRAVEQQISAENRRRDEALTLQKEMTQAQIEEIRARTKAMESGDALIKIDGAGLKPHLEAFMWEILRAIQVRVNQDGLQMLVGV